MTGAEALSHAVARLRQAGIPDAPRDARRLLAHVLNIDPGRLTLILPDPVADAVLPVLDIALDRRVAREPVSHITGRRAFYGRDFIVTPDVLDPRPETETLIAAALACPFSRVLDLGTGSGCILLTLLAERSDAAGLGTDLSAAALDVARANAGALGVMRAEFTQSDWFADVSGVYDLIVSNPPYIAECEMATLAPELSHEPQGALTDGADGLSAYRAIALGVQGHLAEGGRLLVEIGASQAADVRRIFAEVGLETVAIHPDLDGRDRVVEARRCPGGR
ncbi:Protein-N(5)-glutamine methyltransferase PrmC [Rhodovulum sp. P5]|uniref:peptide chain release factor N(5)-glutamine methyltransferase n=1 Tax=Rhodovulum sp. P5 TaxID=1564506 RepID=UPI0009C2D5CE|nr:peptide chain release factor N(5)-glutamine methyltransferase [Rhodovulum sp. P5]ARE39657.1 Protein-N(5)-glutamine methyltransferase PrmC [Rhodovulum sp. P5]